MSYLPDLDDTIPSGPKEIDFTTAHPLFLDLCPEDSYNEDGVYWVSCYGDGVPLVVRAGFGTSGTMVNRAAI